MISSEALHKGKELLAKMWFRSGCSMLAPALSFEQRNICIIKKNELSLCDEELERQPKLLGVNPPLPVLKSAPLKS